MIDPVIIIFGSNEERSHLHTFSLDHEFWGKGKCLGFSNTSSDYILYSSEEVLIDKVHIII